MVGAVTSGTSDYAQNGTGGAMSGAGLEVGGTRG